MKIALNAIVMLLSIAAADVARAQVNSAIPGEVIKSWSALIGDWTVEGFVGPQSVMGSARFEWAEGKHCYLGKQTWEIDGGRAIHLTQIAGWNPNTKETIEQGFSSINDAATVRYPVPAKGGDVVEGTIEGVSGAENRWSGSVKIESQGADKFRLTTVIDGDPVHSLTYVRKAAKVNAGLSAD